MPTRFFPIDAPDSAFLAAVDAWAALLEANDFEAAYDATEHYHGYPGWKPEFIRRVIAEYGDARSGQRVTVEGKSTDIRQRKSVERFPVNQANMVGYVCYDLNINGSVSDLTATFDIVLCPAGLTLVLDDIHVM